MTIAMKKGKEELRFELFKGVGSLRVFYKDGDVWKPGRQGLTLKKSEMREFVAKLKELYALLPDEAES